MRDYNARLHDAYVILRYLYRTEVIEFLRRGMEYSFRPEFPLDTRTIYLAG